MINTTLVVQHTIYCTDVDECQAANGGCAQTCTNTDGSFLCSCGTGYTLAYDGFSCDGNEVNFAVQVRSCLSLQMWMNVLKTVMAAVRHVPIMMAPSCVPVVQGTLWQLTILAVMVITEDVHCQTCALVAQHGRYDLDYYDGKITVTSAWIGNS